MDVAVVIYDKTTKLYSLKILKGEKTSFIEEVALFEASNLTSQPLLLDYDGDMISDLLVSRLNGSKQEYAIFQGGKTFIDSVFDNRTDIQIAESNSHAFIDLNGDGVSDIFLEGNFL